MKFGRNKFFKRKARPLIGVDIGSHTLKVVEFGTNGDSRVLRRIGRALVPRNAIQEGAIKDPEALEEALKTLIQNLQPKIRRAATSVSGYSVIVKKINVPYSDEREIEDNLIFEAENYVPFEIEEVYLDFNVIGEARSAKGTMESEIFLVAAKREVVDSYAELLQNAGLRPAVIDVDGFAIGNAFEGAMGTSSESVVLLDLGASMGTFSIVKDGMPLFTRDMSVGGQQITRTIAETLGIDYSDAETIKIKGSDDPAILSDVSSIVREIVDSWAHEVRKAVEFFKSNASPEEFPKCIWMSGGSSLLEGICDIFEDVTGLETKRFDPFKRVEKEDKIDRDYLYAVAPQFAIATGLALRTEEL